MTLLGVVTLALAAPVGLSGCGGGVTVSSSSTSVRVTTPVATRRAATPTSAARTTEAPPPPPTTSTLGPFPPVRSSSPSPIDAAAIRSARDLPIAFQCLPQVTPIEVPGTGGAPPALVCPSKLADGDAVYLWFVDSPDARYMALKAALARTANVRGGPTWVAGGARAASVAGLGGAVYR